MKNCTVYLMLLLFITGCAADEPIKRIKSIHFSSLETQRATMDSLVTIILSSKGKERARAEADFLAAFPGTWERYKKLYESDGLTTERSHIYVLGQLKSVDHEQLFNKVIDYSIGGKWGADLLQDFYLYEWFFTYGDTLGKVLAKRNDETVKSIFYFLFVGRILPVK